MNRTEAAISPVHKHRWLIGSGNSISQAVQSTRRYGTRQKPTEFRVADLVLFSSVVISFFFLLTLFSRRLKNRATIHTCKYVRLARCRRSRKYAGTMYNLRAGK